MELSSRAAAGATPARIRIPPSLGRRTSLPGPPFAAARTRALTRLRFLTTGGDELAAPPEWQECFIEIDHEDSTLDDLDLRANAMPLALATRRIGGHYRTVGEWPLSGTGGYALELLDRGEIVERRRCEIRPEKLSEQAYRQLIDDLQDRLPATVAIALQRAGALTRLRIIPPAGSTLAEELHRLRRACHGTRQHPASSKSCAPCPATHTRSSEPSMSGPLAIELVA